MKACFCILPLLTLPALGQNPPQVELPSPMPMVFDFSGVPDEPDLLSHEFSLSFEPTPGKPYSSEETSKFERVLGDGNRIVNSTHTVTYRDSKGRMRRETTQLMGNSKDGVTNIIITDPIAGVSYSLDPRTKTATKMPVPAHFSLKFETLNKQLHEMQKQIDDTVPRVRVRTQPFEDEPEVKVHAKGVTTSHEDLGTDTIAGVTAEGTLDTTTIPAGAIGNERPIVVTSERWYSQELGMEMKSERKDPRSGDKVFAVTRLSETEPDASLFQVPSDYTIHSNRFLDVRSGLR